jgi:hypothetical protein
MSPAQKKIIEHEIRAAAEHLAKSDKGRDALCRLVDWLENSGLSLDETNQGCVVTLLQTAWGGMAGTTREAMHEALGE